MTIVQSILLTVSITDLKIVLLFVMFAFRLSALDLDSLDYDFSLERTVLDSLPA